MELRIHNLTIHRPDRASPILHIPEYHLAAGESLAVTGPSGSGKTTLFNHLTGLAQTEKNRILWDSTDIHALSPSQCDRWRGEHIGIIMQEFHLLERLSALDNVILPAAIRTFRGSSARKKRAETLLAQLGINNPLQQTAQHSRGEKQRIAIARALLSGPRIIIADEPTASLDADNARNITNLLTAAAANHATLICMTHDPQLTAALNRTLTLNRGSIEHDTGAPQ